MRRPAPTRSDRRPASSSSSSAPTTSRRQPCSVRTSGSAPCRAHRGDDALQVGARRDQLVGELGLGGAGADQRLAERDQRRVGGVRRRRALALDGDRLALAPARDRLEDRLAAAAQRRPRAGRGSGARRSMVCGRRLAISTSGGVGAARWAPAGPRSAVRLAPAHELAGDGALGGVQRVDARQAVEDRVELALVGGAPPARGTPRAPTRAARGRSSRSLQRVGELEQVQDVLARVARPAPSLSGRAVPARELRALAQPHADHLVQQRLVAELRAQARRSPRRPACRRCCVISVCQSAPQQRDVLAPGVQDDLDVGVGEHLGQRRRVERLASSGSSTVDRTLAVGSSTRDLDEAQQRAVAALAHELRVDAQAPGSRAPGARARRRRRRPSADIYGGPRLSPSRAAARRASGRAGRSRRARVLLVALAVAGHADAVEDVQQPDRQARRR